MSNVTAIIQGLDGTYMGRVRQLQAGDVLTDLAGAPVGDYRSDRKFATIPLVDLTATGTTNLFTVPAAKTLILTKVTVTVTTGSNDATVDPVVGVGIAAGEDDLISPATLTNLRDTGEVFATQVQGLYRTAPAASVIKLGIDTASDSTTLDATVDLFGYFVEDPTASGVSTAGKSGANVYRSTAQAADGAIVFDTAQGNDGQWSGGDPTKLVPLSPGWKTLTAWVQSEGAVLGALQQGTIYLYDQFNVITQASYGWAFSNYLGGGNPKYAIVQISGQFKTIAGDYFQLHKVGATASATSTQFTITE